MLKWTCEVVIDPRARCGQAWERDEIRRQFGDTVEGVYESAFTESPEIQ